MPRNRVRKTSIGLHSEEEMRSAVELVLEGNQKIRAVAKLKNIPFTTLQRYCKKSKEAEGPIRLTPNYGVNKIFTDDQERSLVDYIIKCSQMFYGLTTLEVRQVAYEMAQINNLKVPSKWHDMLLAGVEWLYNFRKRHDCLSLRTPEGCSLSRATSFNRHNVNLFFENLQNVMSRVAAFGNGTRVYNLDETNTMTVQKSAKVLAVKGQKQVSKVTSAEKGTLVTTCYIVSALGNALPPVMIFPRIHFKQYMISEAPAGTLGLATASGWMNSELFVKTMQHFIDHTQSSKENPTLLIMDNFEAHICLSAINLAKENGVTILTVPPHSTGKLQPLDVAIFKPFKLAYNAAVDSWMMRNPGKTFSIYEVGQCVKEAHMKAMTPGNICSAFQATGIFPFNRNIFTDVDFAPSEVTDRPENEENIPLAVEDMCEETHMTKNKNNNISLAVAAPEVMHDMLPFGSLSPSILLPIDASPKTPSRDAELLSVPAPLIQHPRDQSPAGSVRASTSSTGQPKKFMSPFHFRGLPKAGPRKGRRAPRRKGKTMIATDTPNKLEIEKREEEKKQKQTKKIAKTKKRKILQSDSSNEEENDRMSIYSEEEGSFQEEQEDIMVIKPDNFRPLKSLPNEGNFILVEFKVNNKTIFYVAKVLGVKNKEVEASFLRKTVKSRNTFRLPDVPDIAAVSLHDIKLIFPQPAYSGNTKRQQGFYTFDFEFSEIDLR